MDVQSPLSNSLGPQFQGHHGALTSQVSKSVNNGNGARNSVFDPPGRAFERLKTNPIPLYAKA